MRYRSSGRRDRVTVVVILATALAVRVGYIVATPGYTLTHDDRAYDHLALGVSRSGAYPDVGGHATAYRPPGFPYFLAAVYRLSGDGPARVVAARLAQAGLGVVIVAMLGAIAVRLFGRRAAIGTMAVAAVYVPLVAAGTSLLAEPLTIVLELGALLAVLAWRRHGRIRWVVAAGVLGGAVALTRSNAFVVVIALMVGLLVGPSREAASSRLKPVGVLLVAAVLVVAPWTARNAVVVHSFIPVSDEVGGTLAGTYNPVSADDRAAPALWHLLSDVPQYDSQTRILAAGPEPPFQSEQLHLALQYAQHHPLYPLQVAFYNTLRLFGLNPLALSDATATAAGISSPIVADAGVYGFWAVGALALVGSLSSRVRRNVPLFVWLTPCLLYLSIVFVNTEAPRLRLPIDPFVVLVAGAGVAVITDRLAGWNRRSGARNPPGRPDVALTAPGDPRTG